MRGQAAPAASQPSSRPGAREEVFQVRSESFAREFPVTVVLPAGLGPRPLLLLLHGAGGGHRDWPDHADLKTLATRYQRIIVAPTAGPNSWWVDYPPSNFAETFVVKELLAALRARYGCRIGGDGDHWIAGLSMGGYGALRIGLAHPELFRAVGALSPCVRPSQWPKNWDLPVAMGPARARVDMFRADQVAKLSARRPRPMLSILCGRQDFFIKENRWAHQVLGTEGIEHQWLDLEGKHDWNFWPASLERQLEYFQARGAAPASRPAN